MNRIPDFQGKKFVRLVWFVVNFLQFLFLEPLTLSSYFVFVYYTKYKTAGPKERNNNDQKGKNCHRSGAVQGLLPLHPRLSGKGTGKKYGTQLIGNLSLQGGVPRKMHCLRKLL
jgi:hypothetical protein